MNGKLNPDNIVAGDYVVYVCGSRYEIGKVKDVRNDGKAFVWYSEGCTAALTPLSMLHPISNQYVIGETSLGGTTA